MRATISTTLLVGILDLIINNLCTNKKKTTENQMFLSSQRLNPDGRKWLDNHEGKRQRPNSAQNNAEQLKQNYERKLDNEDLELNKAPIDEVPEEMFQTNFDKEDLEENKEQNVEDSLELNNMEPVYTSEDKHEELKHRKNNLKKSNKQDRNQFGKKRKSRSKNRTRKSK